MGQISSVTLNKMLKVKFNLFCTQEYKCATTQTHKCWALGDAFHIFLAIIKAGFLNVEDLALTFKQLLCPLLVVNKVPKIGWNID